MVQSQAYFVGCIPRTRGSFPFYNGTFLNRILSDVNIRMTYGNLIDRALYVHKTWT